MVVNIAFTGGGTGGHIYPGLAVAQELKKLLALAEPSGFEFQIFWIGSSAGMDRGLVEEAGIDFFGIPSGKLRRYFSFKNIADFFKIIAGFFAARKILKKKKAVLLFSKGGFVSVPPCAAAASLGITVFTHESDFSPGLATKINARFVLRANGGIFTSYENTVYFFPKAVQNRVTVSGNPVRAVFHNADPLKGREFLQVGEDERILLILGGSQGAREINDLVAASLSGLTEVYTVVHQYGPNQSWNLPSSARYRPYPYIKEELPHVMAAAELILGRSGAGIWEWAVLGKPMILIPLRGSGTRGDQAQNARYFQKAAAAHILSGEDLNPQTLVRTVNSLAHNNGKRMEMSSASLAIGKNEGTEKIARVLAREIIKISKGEK